MSRTTGKFLAAQNNLDVVHSLYRETGDWYHILKRFPAALMDRNGYIIFPDVGTFDSFIINGRNYGIYQNADTNTLTIRGGISSKPEYKLFAIYPDEVGDLEVVEGAKRKVTVNSYERDSSAKMLCIRKWGLNCVVCDMNFEKEYGIIGEGFIHAHHLRPLSSIRKEYALNPERDLRPVCPNCHVMLHRSNPPFSIEELRVARVTATTKLAHYR